MRESNNQGKTGKLLSIVRPGNDDQPNSPELDIATITDFYASLSPEEREALADFLTLEHTREFPGAKFWAESTRLEAKYGAVLRSAEDKFEALRQQFGVNFLVLRNFILDNNLLTPKAEASEHDSNNVLEIAFPGADAKFKYYVEILGLSTTQSSVLKSCFLELGEDSRDFPGLIAAISMLLEKRIHSEEIKARRQAYFNSYIPRFEANYGQEVLDEVLEFGIPVGDTMVMLEVRSLAELKKEIEDYIAREDKEHGDTEALIFINDMLGKLPGHLRRGLLDLMYVKEVDDEKIEFESEEKSDLEPESRRIDRIAKFLSPRYRKFITLNPYFDLQFAAVINGNIDKDIDLVSFANIREAIAIKYMLINGEKISSNVFKEAVSRLISITKEELEGKEDSQTLFALRRLDVVMSMIDTDEEIDSEQRALIMQLLGIS